MIGILSAYGVFFLGLLSSGLVSYSKMSTRMVVMENLAQDLKIQVSEVRKEISEMKALVQQVLISQTKTETRDETLRRMRDESHEQSRN